MTQRSLTVLNNMLWTGFLASLGFPACIVQPEGLLDQYFKSF